jgi:predicted glycoside hydrolase/deacetylase ChbG (UPF0249 family)
VTRALIVNADDFGRSRSINDGVARAHELGIVTSASLMVRWPAAAEAAAYARARPQLSLGLHADLGEWEYRDDAWRSVYEVVPGADAEAVAIELERQVRRFRELVGADPTHLDTHQHVHREEPVRTVLLRLAKELQVPLRGEPGGPRYCGDFYGQTAIGEPIAGAVSVDRLVAILRALPPGTTELGCHPAADTDVNSSYLAERIEEMRSLCDPRVRETLATEGIDLRSFTSFARARAEAGTRPSASRVSRPAARAAEGDRDVRAG